MLDRIKKAFAPTRLSNDRETREKAIVQARSHGNLRLQSGQFYTKKDVDAKYNRLKEVNFAD